MSPYNLVEIRYFSDRKMNMNRRWGEDWRIVDDVFGEGSSNEREKGRKVGKCGNNDERGETEDIKRKGK